MRPNFGTRVRLSPVINLCVAIWEVFGVSVLCEAMIIYENGIEHSVVRSQNIVNPDDEYILDLNFNLTILELSLLITLLL